MSAHSLDTHRIVKRLQQAGFTDSQAETVTDVMPETREFDLSSLATKADLVGLATKADLAQARAEISEAKAELLKRFIGLSVVQGCVIVTLMKLFPSFGH